jgi:hypothetical protein
MRVEKTIFEKEPIIHFKNKDGLVVDIEICERCGLIYCDMYDSNKAHLKEITMIKTSLKDNQK